MSEDDSTTFDIGGTAEDVRLRGVRSTARKMFKADEAKRLEAEDIEHFPRAEVEQVIVAYAEELSRTELADDQRKAQAELVAELSAEVEQPSPSRPELKAKASSLLALAQGTTTLVTLAGKLVHLFS